ncbi:MAG TPA: T9SS type A sorting domain-containing protein [Chitinophagaceae bacterium]|nr:T9SS type A sorting domain-containing protein [Chitinophagaceae bacterium]
MKNFTFRSLFLYTSFFLLAGPLQSQQTLTQINGWNAYVHLPANYNNTTLTYPTIIFFPGLGEVGTVASRVIAYGPGAYIAQDWNGNVVVDGNTIEFIVISLQPPAAYPAESYINQRIQTIKSLYRVNPNKLYLTGLSHGGWCSTTFVTGDTYNGPYTYASQVAAVVEVQGVRPDDNQPYSSLFDNFAKIGGKLLGFEQIYDNRDIPTRVNRMNATMPNSGIYVQTNFGSGGHCCWNQFYGGQGVQPGIFSLEGVNQNLYQWMARQSLNGGTLPVSLTNFSGYKEGYSNKLRWTTASENNNKGFEVQRSTDGTSFAAIGFVLSQAPGGSSTTQLDYTFIDNQITGSTQLYRLRQVDIDNHSKLSSIVRIKGEKPVTLTIDHLFPNPASTVVNVMIDAPNRDRATLIITDITGRQMSQQIVSIETGSNTIPVDISRLNRGTYRVILVRGNNFSSRNTTIGSRIITVL